MPRALWHGFAGLANLVVCFDIDLDVQPTVIKDKSWNDCVRDDLDSVGLTCHWWRKCQDREGWKGILERLLQRT